jgi:hypothetical protein
MMKLTKTIMALAILGMLSTLSSPSVKPNPKYCKTIAYVINSNDKNYYPGQKICAGQVVHSLSKVTIVCINRNNEFIVKSDEDLKKCGIDSVFPTRPFQKNRARTDSFSNAIQLLSPSGKYLIEQRRQRLVWLPIKGAKRYIVKIIDGDSRPEYITYGSSLLIAMPKSTPSYTVIIQSYSDIREISSDIFKFAIIPESENQIINKYLNNINKLSIQDSIKTSLKLSILGEYNLIDESLSLLKAQIKKNSQDFESYLFLGDIQVQAGLFEDAKISYYKSKLIAVSKKNIAAEKLAQSRLKFIQKDILDNMPKIAS